MQNVREKLTNRFLFSRFIAVTITLQLDTQTVMESDAYGDLDNYAKAINDTLKGRDGIFIDDCQIYRLNIGFELTGRTTFDVEVEAMLPDEFVMKDGLKFYGMPDGLFYPQAEAVWEEGRVDQLDIFNTYAGLMIWEGMVRTKRTIRHDGRQNGLSKLEAFRGSRPAMPLQLGYHRSRAIASGIEIVEYSAWKRAAQELAQTDTRIDQLNEMMTRYGSTLTETLRSATD